MQRWKILAALLFVAVVTGAYLTSGPRVPMDNDITGSGSNTKASPAPSANVLEGKWGVDNQLTNGILLNLSEPVAFVPKDAASLGVEGRPQTFNVKVTNKGEKPLDLSTFTILDTALKSDPTIACSDVFESASGISGLPSDPVVKVNSSATFKWAIVCPGPKGDGLTMTVGLNDQQHLTFKTTLK